MSDENKRKLGEQLVRCVLDDKLSNDKKIKKMDYIIRLGADINAEHRVGYNVLKLAKIIQNDEVVSFLEKRGARDLVVDDDDVHFYEIMGMNDIDLSLNKEKANLFFKEASVENINKFLNILPNGHELGCNVDLRGRDLTELPDFSKIIVGGNFLCDNNQLTTLRGAPREVKGSFTCNGNPLKSYSGKPDRIGGKFIAPKIEVVGVGNGGIDR